LYQRGYDRKKDLPSGPVVEPHTKRRAKKKVNLVPVEKVSLIHKAVLNEAIKKGRRGKSRGETHKGGVIIHQASLGNPPRREKEPAWR